MVLTAILIMSWALYQVLIYLVHSFLMRNSRCNDDVVLQMWKPRLRKIKHARSPTSKEQLQNCNLDLIPESTP